MGGRLGPPRLGQYDLFIRVLLGGIYEYGHVSSKTGGGHMCVSNISANIIKGRGLPKKGGLEEEDRQSKCIALTIRQSFTWEGIVEMEGRDGGGLNLNVKMQF